MAILATATAHLRDSRKLVLYSHDFSTLVGSMLVKLFFYNRVTLVYDLHEFSPGSYLEWYGPSIAKVVSRLEYLGLGLADGVVICNEALAGYVSKITGVQIATVYNCPAIAEIPSVSPSNAKALMKLEDRFVILFAGKVRQEYDTEMLITAAKQLSAIKPNSFTVVIVGPDSTLSPFARRVVQEGLSSVFDFRGWLEYSNLLILYKASDLCYAVSSNSGPNSNLLLPVKMFEAMACGVPVVVREGTSGAKIVQHAEAGPVIDPDETDLTRVIIELQASPEVRRIFHEGGINAFSSTYNWDIMRGRLVGLFSKFKDVV